MAKHTSSQTFSPKLSEIPIGTIFEVLNFMEEPPKGWMRPEGQKLLISKYPRLFKLIGHMCSEDRDSKEYFNLPNNPGKNRFFLIKVKE